MLDPAAQEKADREAEEAEACLVQMRAAKLASSAVEQDAVVQSVARAKALARQEDEERAVAQRNEAMRKEKEAKEQEQRLKQARLKEVAEKKKQAAAAAAEAKRVAAEARAAKARESQKSGSVKSARSTSATPVGGLRPMMHTEVARAAMSAEEERWHEREAEAAARQAAVEAWRNGASSRESSGTNGPTGSGANSVRVGASSAGIGAVGAGTANAGSIGAPAGAGAGGHLRAGAAPFRAQQPPSPAEQLPFTGAANKKELWPALQGTKSSSLKGSAQPSQHRQQRQAAGARAAATAEEDGEDGDAELAAALMASRREAELQEARARAEAKCFHDADTVPAAPEQAVRRKEQPPLPPQPPALPLPPQTVPICTKGPPEDKPWTCATCTLADNSPLALACAACGSERPPEAPPSVVVASYNAETSAIKDDDDEEEPTTTWVCNWCTYANGADLHACEVCSAARAESSHGARSQEKARHNNKPVAVEVNTLDLSPVVAPMDGNRRGGEGEGKRRGEMAAAGLVKGKESTKVAGATAAEAAAEAAFAELSSSQRELALQLVANVGCSFVAAALLATEEFDLDCCLAAGSSDLEEMGLHASDVAQVLAWAKKRCFQP